MTQPKTLGDIDCDPSLSFELQRPGQLPFLHPQSPSGLSLSELLLSLAEDLRRLSLPYCWHHSA